MSFVIFKINTDFLINQVKIFFYKKHLTRIFHFKKKKKKKKKTKKKNKKKKKKKKEKKNWAQNCISFYHVPTSFHSEWDLQYFK